MRWGILAVPSLLYFFSYLHRIAPAVVAGDLMRVWAVPGATLGTLSTIYPYCFAVPQRLGYIVRVIDSFPTHP